MPTSPDNHEALDYSERLPRRLQETREAVGLSMYGLVGILFRINERWAE